MTIRRRLLGIAALGILALAGFTALALYSAQRATDVLSSIYEHEVRPSQSLLALRDQMREVEYRMAAFLLDQLPAAGNRLQLAEARQRTVAKWGEFKAATRERRFSPIEQAAIASIDRNLPRLTPIFDRLDQAYQHEDASAIKKLLEDEWPFAVMATVTKPVDVLIANQEAAVSAAYYDTLSFQRKLTISEFMVVIAAGLALVVIMLRVTVGITRPLNQAIQAADRVAAGEWDHPIDSSSGDEIGQLLQHLSTMREQVRARQQRLETILNNAAEAIITFDERGAIDSFSQAAERLFGYSAQEVVGRDITLLLTPTGAGHEKRKDYAQHLVRTEIERLIGHEGEIGGRHKSGETFPMALKVTKMSLQGRMMYTALAADIRERKALIENLKRLAEHDGLTGLYNRGYFLESLERAVSRAHRGELQCALLYIDLDNFKYVNDTLGHAAGDRLLVDIAKLLAKRTRASDLLARLGGDEFTVLLHGLNPEQAHYAAESFRSLLAGYQFRHEHETVEIGCSIGLAVLDAHVGSASDVLARADVACHLAKRGGRNRVHFYRDADAQNVASMSLDMGWTRRIKRAIDEDRFVLAYQPICNAKTDSVAYHEVLLRMRGDDGELIMPGGFLPSAERFGLAADIDKWVVSHALTDLAERRREQPTLRYAINLSAQSLGDDGVADLIARRLMETEIEPSSVIFEVTETAAISDMAAAEQFLKHLQSLGCLTALDDFGTGMSSFAYLRDLPVDCVKIDGRFVKNIAVNAVDRAMVAAMNNIAHTLGKRTVAEFVEDAQAYAILKEMGIDYGQGYYLGRATPTPITVALSSSRQAVRE